MNHPDFIAQKAVFSENPLEITNCSPVTFVLKFSLASRVKKEGRLHHIQGLGFISFRSQKEKGRKIK